MKIRYYLRGLGLGILITSIFFLVSNSGAARTMSDEQIKARAKELGMIENKVLAEISTEEAKTEETIVEEMTTEIVETIEEVTETVEEPETVETTVEESTEETTETVTEEESQEATQPEETSTEESESVEETGNTASNTEPVTIVVNRGEGSDTVSIRLQEAGLVADAYEYDRYLMANGYDKRIGAGEHVIPAGATWEEIAKELCN